MLKGGQHKWDVPLWAIRANDRGQRRTASTNPSYIRPTAASRTMYSEHRYTLHQVVASQLTGY
jgi:hypothetical protein